MLFVRYGIRPGTFYDLPAGERVLIDAFVQRALEERMEREAV